jgi:hypothetical protein
VNGRLRIASNPLQVVPIEELLTEAEKCKVEEAVRGFLRNHKQKLPANARYILEHYEYHRSWRDWRALMDIAIATPRLRGASISAI